MQSNDDMSVWNKEERAQQGARRNISSNMNGAHDAYRVLDRHKRQIDRTSNRKVVSSYTGVRDKKDNPMFNAVSQIDRTYQHNDGPTFGERSARPTWHSTRNSGYPFSRQNQRKEKLTIALLAVVLVAIIVFLVLAVRGCAS